MDQKIIIDGNPWVVTKRGMVFNNGRIVLDVTGATNSRIIQKHELLTAIRLRLRWESQQRRHNRTHHAT